jgi:hypothetical protein
VQRLGVSHEQIASGLQALRNLLEDALLRGSVEVDDHVAAEDGVEFLLNPVVGIHKVEAAKLDEAA